MEKSEQKEKRIWGLLIFLLSLCETAICRFLLGGGVTDMLRCVLWMALFSGITLLYLELSWERFAKKQDSMQIIFISVLLALPCAYFYGHMKPMAAFYLGAVIIAALVDRGAGIMFSFYLCAAAFIRNSESAENMVSLLALGIVLCLLAGYLKKAGNIPEVIVLAEVVTAILYFLRTSRHGASVAYYALGLELFSTAAVLLCASGAIRLYDRLVPEAGEAKDGQAPAAPSEAVLNEASMEPATAVAPSAENVPSSDSADKPADEAELRKTYEAFLSEDVLLMARMKTEADRVYRSAGKLADIAGKTAAQTSADAVRCRVIAMYHEVGKLVDKKTYIPAGTALMREAGMPEDIIEDIVRIHEKDAKPKTKEAAVVLLALHITNTLNYLKLHPGNFTPDKVVDNAFSVLLQKGILDECGLSIKEYRQLKKSMLMEFTFQN